MIDRRSRSAAETRAPAPAAALARALVLVLALAAPPLEAAPNAVAAAPDAAAIVARAESIMYPDAKGEATLYFRDEKGRSETYRMVYYAKERNQKIIVRFLEPALARGNDLLMIEKSVWALDAASGRVMKVASNQSFGGTGFSYGDVVRLNFTDNYESVIKSETAEEWILGLEAKDRGAPYARIELAVSKAGGWPLRGTCYARSGAVVKEMAYSGAGEIATGRRPLVVSVTSPLDPGSINALTIVSERPLTLPDAAFNKRNLSARMEEKL